MPAFMPSVWGRLVLQNLQPWRGRAACSSLTGARHLGASYAFLSSSATGLRVVRVGFKRTMFSGRPSGEGYQHFQRGPGGGGDSSRSRLQVLAMVGFFPTSLLIYYLTHLEQAPYTGRWRMIDISKEKELEMGRISYQQALQQAQRRGHAILPPNHPSSKLVRKIGDRIAAATQLDFPWEFTVVHSPQVNAFCSPGGKVVVYSGLLQLFNHNEEAVAAVLAHEVGHAVARHGVEQLGFANILLALEFAASLAFNARFATSMLVTLGGRLPYSRKLESEADHIGLHLLARTCHYDPASALTMHEVLGKAQARAGVQSLELLQTHPSDQRRVAKLREWLPEIQTKRADMCSNVHEMRRSGFF
ncbi:peptidase family M48-domain-containing protein [Baffinella frigidus]|nr:peptidase family M48-domain-containing protein [Cryptophyta sp. CCMP2293]